MNRKIMTIIAIPVLFTFLVTACTSKEDISEETVGNLSQAAGMETQVSDEMLEETDSVNEVQEPDLAIPSGDEADIQMTELDTPTWFDVPMVDVRTGQSFTINDYQGSVVLVETLAMWCSSCLRQQGEVKILHDRLSDEDGFVSIGLDIDINEQAQDLKAYTDQHQFDWIYVISPVEVAREISELYGAQFLNPPSTPILVIDKDGEVHLMPFGVKSADELYAFIAPLLGQ